MMLVWEEDMVKALRKERESLREENSRLRQRVEELEEMGRAWRESDEHKNANALRQRVDEMSLERNQAIDSMERAKHDIALWQEKWADAEAKVKELERGREAEVLSWRVAEKRAEAAEAKLAKVVELHQKTKEIGEGYSYNTTTVCAECEQEVPCPTLAAAKEE